MNHTTNLGRVLCLVCLILVGCDQRGTAFESESDKSNRVALVGNWYTVADDEIEIQHSLMALRADGTQTFDAKTWHHDGTVSEKRYSGTWYVTDGVFKLKHDFQDGQALAHNDGFAPFQIVAIDNEQFAYRYVLGSRPIEYRARRVSAEFSLSSVRTTAKVGPTQR